jgi:hypothetical protein
MGKAYTLTRLERWLSRLPFGPWRKMAYLHETLIYEKMSHNKTIRYAAELEEEVNKRIVPLAGQFTSAYRAGTDTKTDVTLGVKVITFRLDSLHYRYSIPHAHVLSVRSYENFLEHITVEISREFAKQLGIRAQEGGAIKVIDK